MLWVLRDLPLDIDIDIDIDIDSAEAASARSFWKLRMARPSVELAPCAFPTTSGIELLPVR
jgi:hypothetical protein